MSDPLLENPPVHTLRSRLQDARYYALYHLLRHAPIDMVSALGSAMVRWSVPRNRPAIIANARANLRRLRPDLGEAAVEAHIASFLDNVGRMMAEFAVLPRLHRAGRIGVGDAFERRVRSVRERPTVAIALHTGNWEVCAAALHARGIPITTFAIPPETWAQRVIATKVRKQLGATILRPDPRGLRDARTHLQRGGTVSIFCDEAKAGRTMAPLFGRAPHRDGNLAIAAWLARSTGARMVFVYCRRTEKSRFSIDCSEYFDLPAPTGGPREQQALADVTLLNALMEPIILANLDQWYFLDNALD